MVFAETPLFMDFTLEGLEELLRSISIKEVAEAASKRILNGLSEVFSQKRLFEGFLA